MYIAATEIPEGFSSADFEPEDLQVAKRFNDSIDKLPVSAISDTGTAAMLEMPRNEEENQLAAACYKEAKAAYDQLSGEERKTKSPGVMAADLFSERVASLRTSKEIESIELRPTPAPTVNDISPELMPQLLAGPSPEAKPEAPPSDRLEMFQRSSLREAIDQRTRVYGRLKPVPWAKQKRFKKSEIDEILGIPNYGLIPVEPTVRVDFIDPNSPTRVVFSVRAHWVCVQADEWGIDKTLGIYIDRRYEYGGDEIPAELGRKQGQWIARVVTAADEYSCSVMDTRIVNDFFKIRLMLFLIMGTE